MIKRLMTLIISPLMLISLFIIPVKAEQDYTYFAIDYESYSAYQYFASLGASMVDQDVSTQSSEVFTGSANACITVPQHYETGVQDSSDPGITYYTYSTYNMVLSPCSGNTSNMSLTSTNTDRVRWVRPKIKVTSYTNPNSYDSTYAVMCRAGEDYVLGFQSTINFTTADFSLLENNDTNYLQIKELRLVDYSAPLRTYRLVIHNTNESGYKLFDIIWPSNLTTAILTPLYSGHLNNMSDDMGRMLGYDTGVARLIESGNEESQDTSEDLEDVNSTFTNTSQSLINFETSFTGQMDQAMGQINLQSSSGLLSVSGFTNALTWVVSQFNSLISPAPIQSALLLMLTFGLAMYLIGMK